MRRPQDAIPAPPDPDPDEEVAEEDLWFLPGPDPEEDIPPGAVPAPREPPAPLFDSAPWRAAQSVLAPELAEVAGLFGALDERLRGAPPGWRRRLALREVSDLTWWTGDRLDPDRIALWVTLRAGSTGDTERALARAGWALRRLGGGPAPAADLAGFLDRPRAGRAPSPKAPREAPVADLAGVLAAEGGLHPAVAGARLFHAWQALGPAGAADLEAAVLGARHAAGMARAPGQGALFLPLAQTGRAALRGQGDPARRLADWLEGAARATQSALLHLDRVARWEARAKAATADLSGRTPPALLALLAAWPQVSAPLAERETGASRAAVQRNLATFTSRGILREVTGQGRFRVWTAAL